MFSSVVYPLLSLQAQLAFFVYLMPSSQLALAASAASNYISALMSGAVLPLSIATSPLKALSYISFDRYLVAGTLYHLWGNSRKRVAGFYGSPDNAMRQLELDVFESAGMNALVCFGFYLFYTVGGLLCLKYLHKERR